MPVATYITAMSYVVAIVAIFGISTVIATNTKDDSKNFSGLIPKRKPKTIEANVIIEGGNNEDGTIAIGEKLKAIVVVNESNNMTNFKLSWIDADSGKLVTDEKLLDKTCAIFEENNTDIAEGCSLTYEIQKGDENKTIAAQVDFFNEKGEILSTVVSNQTRKVILPQTSNNTYIWIIFALIDVFLIYLFAYSIAPVKNHKIIMYKYILPVFFCAFLIIGVMELLYNSSEFNPPILSFCLAAAFLLVYLDQQKKEVSAEGTASGTATPKNTTRYSED